MFYNLSPRFIFYTAARARIAHLVGEGEVPVVVADVEGGSGDVEVECLLGLGVVRVPAHQRLPLAHRHAVAHTDQRTVPMLLASLCMLF